MKLYQITIAAFFGVFAYVAIALIGGNNGYFAGKHLREQKMLLAAQNLKIQNLNDALELECAALEKDPEIIAAYARKLGFVRENEKLVKINGLKPVEENLYDTGTIVRYVEPYSVPEWFCKVCGLIVTFAVWLMIFVNSKKVKKINKPAVKEIPIYDLPQI